MGNCNVNWKKVSTLFLDMDGTLLDLQFDNYFWRDHLPAYIARVQNRDTHQVTQELLERYKHMRGTLDWYCLEYWQNDLSIDIMRLKRELTPKICFRPSAEIFLTWAKEQPFDVVLLTNSHRWGLELKFSTLDIAHYFDRVISSHDYQVPKERRQFWDLLANDSQYDYSKSLLIDDNEAVLTTANSIGVEQLLSIRWPDSLSTQPNESKYAQVHDFRELML